MKLTYYTQSKLLLSDKVVNGQAGPFTTIHKKELIYKVTEMQHTVKNHHRHLLSITIIYQLKVC